MNASDITTYKSLNPGKKLVVMGGVHGDETCGAEAIRILIPRLKITAGQVTFIIGNPRALKMGVRMIDADLNRLFTEARLSPAKRKSLEYRRAQEILPFLRECDALLDIHSMNHPQSPPFIICEPRSFELAKRLPFGIRSTGWNAIHPGSADAFVHTNGGFGLCIECGYKGDHGTTQRAVLGIENFLRILGAIEGTMPAENAQRVIRVKTLYRTRMNFVLSRSFGNFETIHKGTQIGTDGGNRVYAQNDCLILFAYNKTRPNEQAFLLAEETLRAGRG